MIHSGAGRAMLTSLGYATEDLTLGKVLARQCRERPGKTFLRFTADGSAYSYAELDRISNRLANGLTRLGLAHGSHVALLMENSPAFIFLVFALGKIGAVTVPVNTAAKGQLLQYYLAQSDSVALIADDALLERLQAIDVGGLKLRDVVVVGAAGAPPRAATLHGLAAWDYVRDLESAVDDPPALEVHCSDLAFISYTSGTTGPSKGNMLSHAAALSVGLSNAEHYGYRPEDVVYTCLPLFHLNALQAATFGMLVTGATLVLSRRFSVTHYWREVREARATITNLLGSMLNFLWNQPESEDDLANDLRFASCVPVPHFGRDFERRFGLRIVSNYALSDYGMVTAYTSADPPEKLGSAGRPRLNFEVRIVDDDDRDLPDGEVGEIVARTTMRWRSASGYYNMPEATQEARRNQWFHTGDRGRFDEDGYLYFVDRKKDAIRRRGENISAFEVERIIDSHPAVAESAVFPVRAEASEDEVGAAVILKTPGALTETALIEYCRDNMAYFMVPRYVEMRAELPRTLNQKVEKYQLRRAMEANLESVWDRVRAGVEVKR